MIGTRMPHRRLPDDTLPLVSQGGTDMISVRNLTKWYSQGLRKTTILDDVKIKYPQGIAIVCGPPI